VGDELDAAKASAARSAAEKYVRPGLKLALGTGSTAAHAVRAVRERYPDERFDCVASSVASEELARSLGYRVRPLAADDRFDLMLDGADEVAPNLDLTKGGGGALFREKYLARLSAQLVILVDPSKLVEALGQRAPIPLEVVPFAVPVLARQLEDDGFDVRVRTARDGHPYLTDNDNAILDLRPPSPVDDAGRLDAELRERPGVIETGLFLGLADRAIVGQPDGKVRELLPPAKRNV
jgi:ribose 5-phosphate isomerase A